MEENRDPGANWKFSSQYGLFPTYCIDPVGKRRVSITLPDGAVEKFTLTMKPACRILLYPAEMEPQYTPEAGTTSKLEAVKADGSTYTHLNLNGGRLIDGLTAQDFNPQFYRLTTRAGYVYLLEQASASGKGGGIRKVTDPNGNVLTFSSSGITHSDGTGVTFSRDAQQRITAITDPNGAVQRYGYDLNGDLVTHTDTLGNITTYAYAPTPGEHAHALVEIKDPLNRPLVKNLYDAQGRLYAQEDNDGNRTLFEHALAGRYSIVTDRNGNREILEYNERGDVVRRTDALNHVWTTTYDAFGNVLTETDPLDRTTTRVVTASGDVLSTADALGNTSTNHYDARGRVLSSTDANGHTTTREYDTAGNLTAIVDAAGEQLENRYFRGNLVTSIDALGVTTTYGYDAQGRQTRLVDGLGVATTRAYDANGNRLTEAKPRTLEDGAVVSEVTRWTFDAKNRITATLRPDGATVRIEYDANGNPTATVDSRGNRTENTWDVYDRLLSTTYPDGTAETYTYDAEGNTLTETDRLGRTTRYEYDALSRVARTVYPDGTSTQNEYDAAGQLVAEIDERGSRTEHAYDAAGRRISTADPLGHVTTFGYDANGNRTSVTDANGNTTQFVFAALDRLVETIHPDGTSTAETFDAVGQRTAATDELGRSTRFAWDAEGRLTQVTDPLGNVTRYGYDEHGNKVSQTDAEGRTTHWGYDLYGRLTAHTLPLGQTERWVLDTAGIVQRHRSFDGSETLYTSDSDDRPTRIAYADGNVETFVYDAVGNRIEATDANGTTTYAYDARDRLVHESRPDGSELLYDYDAAGNRTQVTAFANGTTRVTRYVYDAAGRNTQVIDHDGRVTRQVFDAVGNLVRIELPNGLVTTHAYDSRHRLTRITTRDAGGTMLEDVHYTLDATGKRVRVDEQSGAASRSTVYTYDAAGRLTGESVTDPANGDRMATYGYDRVGNRTTETVNGIGNAYSYDANDRLLAAGATSYGYDAIGNLVLRQDASGTAAYGWDAKRRMTSASVAGKSISYRYNVDDIRTRKVVNGSATDYLVDHNTQYPQVVAELRAANDAWYTLGDSRRISRHAANDASYYLADAQGTTKALADATGDITSRYAYSAFGELLNQTGSAQNDFRYTGEQYDEDLGQYYLRARYYDPSTGRFTRMDVHPGDDELPKTQNKYIYAGNDPVLNVDPLGFMYTIADMNVATRVNGGVRSAYGSAAERQAAELLKFLKDSMLDEAKGYAIDLIIREASGALAYAMNEAERSGTPYKNAGAQGTAAHQRLKKRMEKVNRFLKRIDVSVDSEMFVDDKKDGYKNGERPRSGKGTISVDIVLWRPAGGKPPQKPYLVLDLKTGKGFSKNKRERISQAFGGTDVIEILVRKK